MIWSDISDELMDILTPYSDWFFQQDLTSLNKLAKDNSKNTDTMDNGCSTEYFQNSVLYPLLTTSTLAFISETKCRIPPGKG